jgi:SsrA-binding protein
MGKPKQSASVIASNRKAYHDYEVLEKLEVGLVLTGTEIKSLRSGKVSLQEAHARIFDHELVLMGMTIPPYAQGGYNNHAPLRDRKLLAHKKEIKKLQQKMQEKGLALIPLKLYFARCWVKVELGLCRGKKLHDKRDTIKMRDVDRHIQQMTKRG